MDRYTGTYSGGAFTAWNLEFYNIPEEVCGGDIDCCDFWKGEEHKKYIVGIGNTIEEATFDLLEKLNV